MNANEFLTKILRDAWEKLCTYTSLAIVSEQLVCFSCFAVDISASFFFVTKLFKKHIHLKCANICSE